MTGTKAAVGPPWFDRYTVPLALILVLLSGIGPVIAWRRATWANARRMFLWPVVAAAVALVVLLALGVNGSATAVAMFVCATFVVAVITQEFARGVSARRAMTSEGPARALVSLVRRNRRRYGGYTVHVGMAVLFVGVAASTAFQHARDVRLSRGQTASVGGYQVTYKRGDRAAGLPGPAVGARGARRRARCQEGRSSRGHAAHQSRLLPVGGAVRLGEPRAGDLRGRGDI